MSALRWPEEGGSCPGCHGGTLEYDPVGCSCHISPPCEACVSNPLRCPECDWEAEPWTPENSGDFKVVPFGPGISSREYRPKPLDKTRIDWRVKGGGHASMVKEGVYPEGTTRVEVEEEVKGAFGGRFQSFKDGRFNYIAYTD